MVTCQINNIQANEKKKLTGQVSFLVGIPNAKYQKSEQQQSHNYTSNNPASVEVTWRNIVEKSGASHLRLEPLDGSCVMVVQRSTYGLPF